MAGDAVSLASRFKEVLERLGDDEPTTRSEAQAVLENIRFSKGFLDDETVEALQTIPDRNRDMIMRLVEKGRETEAAYTTR